MEEDINWMVLEVDEDEKKALCIAQKVVAFFPYDGAESGMRGSYGDLYYKESEAQSYTEEQLRQFWGSSEWESANIRSWLNSEEAVVTYSGTKPTTDTTSLYENGYETQPGFLYGFTDEEIEQLIATKVTVETPDGTEGTNKAGATNKSTTKEETEDRVFLLSRTEVEKYFLEQNRVLSTTPTECAVLMDGTGLYKEYSEQGENNAFWGLRTQGDQACSILCAGSGFGKTENFHSEYACSSLMGVRPAIVLPLEYIESLKEK